MKNKRSFDDEDDFLSGSSQPAKKKAPEVPAKRKLPKEAERPKKALPAPAKKVMSTEADVEDASPVRSLVTSAQKVALENAFGDKASTVLAMLDVGDTDGASTILHRSLLRSLTVILPQAEAAVIASGGSRGLHGYNQTMSQAREMLHDLQAQRDRGMLGQSLVERHLRPAFMDIGVQLQMAFLNLETQAVGSMSKDDAKRFRDTLAAIKLSLSTYITSQYETVSKDVAIALS